MPQTPSTSLSKSRFVRGWQCHRQLWWSVHEPDAEELKPNKVLLDRFDQGSHVGRIARERFPGGVLIDLPHRDPARVTATRAALDAGAPAVFEATFVADGVFVAVDVLQRNTEGFTLIEVKSSSECKEEHVPDAAIQTHVLRRSGIDVRRVEVMHLNKQFRHPDSGELFGRTEVTAEVEKFLPGVPQMIADQIAMLGGAVPDQAIGLHCSEPWDCPFHDRCWPDDPLHISTLYNNGPKRTWGYMVQGIHSVMDIPSKQKLPDAAKRQLAALRSGSMIVEPGLKQALTDSLGDARLGYLDFETINRAVPVWNGLGPWHAAVVQFSYHEHQGDDRFRHAAYLAEGPHDPRPELCEHMLEATRDAERIVMYSPFERTRIKELADQVPSMATDLLALAGKMVDLLPIVRNHVYHPGFKGSFSLKYILSPLVPDLTYNDLAIVDGLVASVEIARLLFVAHLVEERDQLRRDLLAYCERDTWAMVRLVQRLRELSGDGGQGQRG